MEKKSTLFIDNLFVSIENTPLLHNITLTIEPGTTHVLMGQNGSGKSSLAHTIMGHPSYRVTNGTIKLEDLDCTNLPVHLRAKSGIFLAFQHPLEIPGVSVVSFLRQAYSAKNANSIPLDEFHSLLNERLKQLSIPTEFALRGLNEGFSGGEKKKLELLQLLLLQPKIAILDEIDSGLDIDALHVVAAGIKQAKKENPSLSLLLITHYQRILNYLEPDFIHIMAKGSIITSGDSSIAQKIEDEGYESV